MPDGNVEALNQRLREAELQTGRLANTLVIILYLAGAAILFWIDGRASVQRHQIIRDIFRFFCAIYGVGGIPAAGWIVEKIKHSRTWA